MKYIILMIWLISILSFALSYGHDLDLSTMLTSSSSSKCTCSANHSSLADSANKLILDSEGKYLCVPK